MKTSKIYISFKIVKHCKRISQRTTENSVK